MSVQWMCVFVIVIVIFNANLNSLEKFAFLFSSLLYGFISDKQQGKCFPFKLENFPFLFFLFVFFLLIDNFECLKNWMHNTIPCWIDQRLELFPMDTTSFAWIFSHFTACGFHKQILRSVNNSTFFFSLSIFHFFEDLKFSPENCHVRWHTLIQHPTSHFSYNIFLI